MECGLKKKKKIIIGVVVAFFVIGIIGSFFGSDDTDTAPESTAAPESSVAPESTAKHDTEENESQISTAVQETQADSQKSTSNKSDFIKAIKTAIQDAIGENEAITAVTLKNKNVHIVVDLSNADPSPLTIEDLALSRAGSISDSFLDVTDYDDLWDTVTIDFGNIGKITNNRSDIQINEVGRYFDESKFVLE